MKLSRKENKNEQELQEISKEEQKSPKEISQKHENDVNSQMRYRSKMNLTKTKDEMTLK